ncbi:MAG TPA: efflux transporter outer membrane subunit [Rhizomicrobium sp.]|jgi:NodT family efflux transporter outer membrane factor (OMF) lipoprotein|nr:efflux transporter outer membrane subunit [Rhizomicrobium sp.]
MNKTPLAALLALLLAGCTTQVPQALSPQLVPKNFTSTVPVSAPVWPEAQWWSSFGDPAMTKLVTEAQENNRDIAAAAARVMQAEAQATVQRSALFPQIDAQAQHTGSQCSGDACRQFLSGKTFSLGFNATYELDFWGLARNNLRAAQEELKSARFAQQAVAMTVTANVASRYMEVLALRSRLAIAHQQIDAINNILQVITLRVKAGADSHLDLMRERTQLESVQAQLPTLETQERLALFALAVLLGRPPENFDIDGKTLDNIAAPAVGAGLPADLLLRRPDVASAEADLAAAHANLDAARAAFLPQISLSSAGGFASTAIGTLLNGSNTGLSYGADLLQAIFDGGKLAGGRDLAEGVQREALATYQGKVLNAYSDVEGALTQYANARRSEEHLHNVIEAAREAFAISQLQYRQGAADLLNVLFAQQTLFAAQDQMVQVTLANRQAAVHLFEALGGGWQEAPEDRTQMAAGEDRGGSPNR